MATEILDERHHSGIDKSLPGVMLRGMDDERPENYRRLASFLERLDELMRKRDIKQNLLGRASGVHSPRISDWRELVEKKSNRGGPTVFQAADLADVLGVTIESLLGLGRRIEDAEPRTKGESYILEVYRSYNPPPDHRAIIRAIGQIAEEEDRRRRREMPKSDDPSAAIDDHEIIEDDPGPGLGRSKREGESA